ncbi:MAG: hypothetical protein EB002_06855 [Betaproteobacteria bacterium]|nr:hypothetical protein [Betaproteobacteria bacterium]
MAWDESKSWLQGNQQGKYYQGLLDDAEQMPARNSKRHKVVHPENMPWEMARQGLLNTIHQHFNADPDRPVRLISSINRIFKYCGLNDLEQIENAPEFDPSVKLDGESILKYLRK